jgi:hypothetical protein
LRVADFDNLRDLVLQLLRGLGLLIEILGLKQLVEQRNYLPIDLSRSVRGTFSWEKDLRDQPRVCKLLGAEYWLMEAEVDGLRQARRSVFD